MSSDARAGAVAITLTLVVMVGACSKLVCYWCPAPPRDVVSDGLGGPETCYRKNVAESTDDRGNVAMVRVSYCPGQDPVDLGYDFFIVFVHRTGAINSREDIALQYVPSPTGLPATAAAPSPAAPWFDELTPSPKVAWLSDDQLDVFVQGSVQTMVVQKDSVGGIGVRYRFEDGPPTAWNAGLAGDKNHH